MKDYSNTVEISVIKNFCKLPLIKHYHNAYELLLNELDLAISNFSVIILNLHRSDLHYMCT